MMKSMCAKNMCAVLVIVISLFVFPGVSNSSDYQNLEASGSPVIVIAGDYAGWVYAFQMNSSSSGYLLWSHQMSSKPIDEVAVTDLDADGEKEVVVAATDGKLHSLDLMSGAVEWTYTGNDTEWGGIIESGDRAGEKDFFIADIDGDGFQEILTYNGPPWPIQSQGYFLVIGHDGMEKASFPGPKNAWSDGFWAADVNGDGTLDSIAMFGSGLYPRPQPVIQVVDFSDPTPTKIRDFGYDYGGCGMTSFSVGNIDSDVDVEFLTAGWWCPNQVMVYDNDGTVKWGKPYPGGNADRAVLIVDDPTSPSSTGLLAGMGSYYPTTNTPLFRVVPWTGDIVWRVDHTQSGRDFLPIGAADIDGDGYTEVIAILYAIGGVPLNNIIYSIDYDTGTVETTSSGPWTHRIVFHDFENDGASEVIGGKGNSIVVLGHDLGVLFSHPTEGWITTIAKARAPAKPELDCDPDTLNLKSRGKWITCYLELPGADPRDVDPATVLLDDEVAPVLDPKYGFVSNEGSYIVDHDGDGILERIFKFSRDDVATILTVGDNVELRIAGQTLTGTVFEASDYIRVISPP